MARRPTTHASITSRRVPRTPGPGVHAVRVDSPGATLFIGQLLPLEPPMGKVCAGPIRRQMELLMAHLRAVVEDGGLHLDHVVRCTLHLVDLKHMAIVDEVYAKTFVGQAVPARTVLQVAGLPQGTQVSLDAVALRPADPAPPAALPPNDGYGDEGMY